MTSYLHEGHRLKCVNYIVFRHNSLNILSLLLYHMNNYELTIQITYTSILKDEYRNHDCITRIVENASIVNKNMSIGGQIEIQCPFKFIKQTIFGKESATMSLYRRIQNDCRHTITSEHIEVINEEICGEWGMKWVNREIGKHYCIVDTMELHAIPYPKKNNLTHRDKETYKRV